MKNRPLGTEQRAFLQALVDHRYWYAGGIGCGWSWGSPSGTERLCDALAARGLVTTTTRPSGLRPDATVTAFVPTDAGIALVAEWRARRPQRLS